MDKDGTKVYGPEWGLSRPHANINLDAVPANDGGNLKPIAGHTQFNWSEVFKMDGEEDMALAASDDPATQAQTLFVKKLLLLVEWLLDENLATGNELDLNRPKNLAVIARKCLAMAWVIYPERFDNASLTRLCESHGLNLYDLSRVTSDFSKKFSVKNQWQQKVKFPHVPAQN